LRERYTILAQMDGIGAWEIFHGRDHVTGRDVIAAVFRPDLSQRERLLPLQFAIMAAWQVVPDLTFRAIDPPKVTSRSAS
jgi:hypothetical protein